MVFSKDCGLKMRWNLIDFPKVALVKGKRNGTTLSFTLVSRVTYLHIYLEKFQFNNRFQYESLKQYTGISTPVYRIQYTGISTVWTPSD